MNNRLFLTFIAIVFFSLTNNLFAQNKTMAPSDSYDQLWKQVDESEQASLPKSATETVDVIYQKALKEKNSPELLKALIHKMKYELVIDQNTFPKLIADVEKYTANNPDMVEQSVLYSMISQLYFQYFQQKYHSISQRTALFGYVPDDISEWTSNIFMQKIADNVYLSLKAEKQLQSADALKYKVILTEGDASRKIRPSLYDFLVSQGVELLTSLNGYNPGQFFPQSKFSDNKYLVPANDFIRMQIPAEPYDFIPQILKIYQKLIAFRLNDKNPEALLLAELDRIEFVYNNIENDNRGEWYANALSALEKQYAGNEICVEILYKKALYYQMNDIEDFVPLMTGTKKKPNYNKAEAYRICEEGIRKYPQYKRIDLLKTLKGQLSESRAYIESENAVYPGNSLELKVVYQNVNKLTVEIYKINSTETTSENGWNVSGKYEKSGTLVEAHTFQLNNEFPYIESDTVFSIPMKEVGSYEYVIRADVDQVAKTNLHFAVSRLTSVSRFYDNKYEFLVVDRLSGKPIEGATVSLFKYAKNKMESAKTLVTGKDGIATQPFSQEDRLEGYAVSLGNDNALTLSFLPWGNGFTAESNNVAPRLDILTDRSIYRPGQTVYFKAIAYTLQKDSQRIVENQKYTISLKGMDGNEIISKTFRTSDMGSFSGEFILPQNVLNGYFTIASQDNTGAASFRVEEYKRPGFDIVFQPVKETYNFGDRITLKGEVRTFSGVNVQNSKVKYQVVQQRSWLWGWGRQAGNQVAEGFVETNETGQFEVSFIAEQKFNDKQNQKLFYTYTISASLTDEKGETQQTTTAIAIGAVSMNLVASVLSGNVDKDNLPEVKAEAKNLNGVSVDCKGTYEVYSLIGEQSLKKEMKPEDWKRGALVLSGNFTTGEKIDIHGLKNLQTGSYRFVMKANDNKGREASDESDFVLFSAKDKQPPVIVYEWLIAPKTECAVGENAEIIYGSSAKNVYVLYDVFKDNKKIETSRFELNNNLRKITIPFKESYGDGVVVCFTFVKDAKLFQKSVNLYKKKPSRALELKMEVFRDKLLPGQKEEWKISVKDADKKAVQGEVLAGMYDASLDKINGHAWYFYPMKEPYLHVPTMVDGYDLKPMVGYIHLTSEQRDIPSLTFDQFNWFGLSFYGSNLLRAESRVYSMSASPTLTGSVKRKAANREESLQEVVAVADQGAASGGMAESLKQDAQESVQIRKNLNETAFFYPQLRTNEAGETLISFTVPESNTSWKFMALAHTKDLKFGQIIETAITQKKLMVNPNMPRFIRHGDKTTLSATISNLSEESIQGKVSIAFFDPATEKQTIMVAQEQQDFSVEAGKTTSASWTFDVPSNIDITACKIIAVADNFSDGEQQLLPVLPNKMLVTESLPLYISGKGTKNFTFDNLVNNKSTSLENYRLTLEFASNPAWYAVQSLPAMAAPTNESAISWFAAFYANSVATSIANSSPKIKQVIDIWTKLGGTKETLVSNLEKNQELKAVLLEETPWVMEAKNETEQKQRLGLLFDVNRSANLNNAAITKLKELKNSDDGWAWFKGMSSSVSITQWMLYGIEKLIEMKAMPRDSEFDAMVESAFLYIDNKFVEHFAELKKYDKNWQTKNTISTYELEYLYVRGFSNEGVTDETAEAKKFYAAIVEKYWTKIPDLYGRALAALVMQQNGKVKLAKSIVEFLRQHAVQKEEMGMYWVNNNTNVFMFQSAVAVHTFIMEAFEKTGASQKEMDAMKLWLLKQKQTQEWESTPATVNAVMALVRGESNWLASDGNATISLGGKTVDISDKEAGTGYFKQTYEAGEIKPEMGKVSISKEDEGPAWGALYRQYFEQLDKITKAKTSLNVEKMLFVEKISGSGKTLVPVTEKNPLQIGDKVVVRLTIRNDRDMEYVMLKDMRAACFEPEDQISGTKWKERVVYYQSSKDASTNFYFYNLPKGTYVFEYSVYVNRSGEYSNGITTIQCMYAPEFVSNTEGMKIVVKAK